MQRGVTDDDDEIFFSPLNSSKLSSILQTTDQGDDFSSLKYSAPKQPCSKPPAVVKKQPTFVKMVYGYKYVNQNYEPLGKVGLAFIETANSIILYKDPNNHILNLPLNHSHFTLCENKYLTFYDPNKQNWSILFENPQDLNEFRIKLQTTNAKFTQELPKTNPNRELPPTSSPKSSKSELLSNILLDATASKETDRLAGESEENTIKLCTTSKVMPRLSDPCQSEGSVNTAKLSKIESKIDKIYERLRSEQELELQRQILDLQFENNKLKLEMERQQFTIDNYKQIDTKLQNLQQQNCDQLANIQKLNQNDQNEIEVKKCISDNGIIGNELDDLVHRIRNLTVGKEIQVQLEASISAIKVYSDKLNTETKIVATETSDGTISSMGEGEDCNCLERGAEAIKKVHNYEDQRPFLIKKQMNELFTELQDHIISGQISQVKSIIIQNTYKLIKICE